MKMSKSVITWKRIIVVFLGNMEIWSQSVIGYCSVLIMVHIFTVYATIFFIHTTCFEPNGSSSGAFSYTSLVIELQRNIRTFTLTYIGHNRYLSLFIYIFVDVPQ
jgi:hypothetical protein